MRGYAMAAAGCVMGAAIFGAGCQAQPRGEVTRTRETPTTVPAPVSSQAVDQQTFGSPDQAVSALKSAAQAGDRDGLKKIFGPEMEKVAVSDPAEQATALKGFSARLAEKTSVETAKDGNTANLYIGTNESPFPIPLVKGTDGKWFFDTAAGEDEILNRRIGRDELDTIDFCHVLVNAERDYASSVRDGSGLVHYADRFISTAGKHDGLFWPAKPWEAESPLGPLVAQAAAEGKPEKGRAPGADTGDRHPFHGYYYKILTRQGADAPGGAFDYKVHGELLAGFAFVAYPADYGKSGVMTFMVSRNNLVYQKDLGPLTAAKASLMTSFDPSKGWTVVKEGGGGAPVAAK